MRATHPTLLPQTTTTTCVIQVCAGIDFNVVWLFLIVYFLQNTMTRTARAAFPRAIIKDRSQSRSGFSKEMKKGGAGSHNWGKLGEIENENELEYDSEGDSAQMTRSSVNDGGFFFAPCDLILTHY